MKSVEKKKLKKSKNKPKSLPKAKVLVVAQELKFARLLAGNEKKSRDRVLKALKKWLANCFEKGYEFKEDDFIRVWKGLFYAVWMSDKPLVQEELCESIAGTLELFPAAQYRHALLMMKAGLRVLATEWYGLDQHRFDKFLMLVRRWLRAGLRAVGRRGWTQRATLSFAEMLTGGDGLLAPQTPSYARNALSLILHICDCYLEEICKTVPSTISPASLCTLYRPLLALVSGGSPALAGAASRALKRLVMASEPGLEYEERRRAWQQMGCPAGGPDALEPASDDDEEKPADEQESDNSDDDDDDKAVPLDPRAGRVNVSLKMPAIPATELAAELRALLRGCGASRHRSVKAWAERFESLARNEYPYKVSVPESEPVPAPRSAVRAARDLRTMERGLVADQERMALKGLSRKQRKRLLARSRAGQSIVAELAELTGHLAADPPANTTNGYWKIEDASPNKTEDICNKENVEKHKNNKKRKVNDIPAESSPQKKQKTDEIAHKPKVKETILKITIKDKSAEKKHEKKLEKAKKREKINIIITASPKKEKTAENKHKDKKDLSKSRSNTPKIKNKEKEIKIVSEKSKKPVLAVNKVKNFQKQTTPTKQDKKIKKTEKSPDRSNLSFNSPKKVKFVLKNNSMQGTVDYYKSIRQSPNIPYDGSKKPSKTNLKPNSTPSPINPFFKKKLRQKK